MRAATEFEFDPRMRTEGNEKQIFDPLRKKWVLLQPEEWVRQYYVAYMSIVLDYPLSRMRCEVQVKGAGRPKRADLIIYDRQGEPIMLCEFKAMNVPINEETIFQAARYNHDLNAKFILVANGKQQTVITIDTVNGNHIQTHGLPERAELE